MRFVEASCGWGRSVAQIVCFAELEWCVTVDPFFILIILITQKEYGR